jgi:hypothetical protein
MKKTLLLILFLISTIGIASVHKDMEVYETYGNIKVFLRTGFHYSEVEKIKVIGKLSEKLSLKLSHKDTIFIEYIQDYTDIYSKDIYTFENNTNWSFNNGLRSDFKPKKIKPGISIRINANKIKIVDVLCLVEYAILNHKNLPEKLVNQKVIDRWGDNDQELEFKIKSVSDELLNQIFSQKSELVQELISERTYINKVELIGIETYWMNDKFTFEYKFHDEPIVKLIDVTDYYYYLELGYKSLLIFINENKFYYAKPDDESNNKLLELNSSSHIPFNTINMFINKIVLYNNSNKPPNDFYILLTDKRKVISKFE